MLRDVLDTNITDHHVYEMNTLNSCDANLIIKKSTTNVSYDVQDLINFMNTDLQSHDT